MPYYICPINREIPSYLHRRLRARERKRVQCCEFHFECQTKAGEINMNVKYTLRSKKIAECLEGILYHVKFNL